MHTCFADENKMRFCIQCTDIKWYQVSQINKKKNDIFLEYVIEFSNDKMVSKTLLQFRKAVIVGRAQQVAEAIIETVN